jgi:hypothetical protein
VVREQILTKYPYEDFTDVRINVPFTVLGWLAGKGDFSDSICIAVNCGKDTDCTGATVGSLMGILQPDCIPEKWLKPIGRDLVVSREIVGVAPPDTLDGFTDLVLGLQTKLGGRLPKSVSNVPSAHTQDVNADIAFLRDLPAQRDLASHSLKWHPLTFKGSIGYLPSDNFQDEVALLRYKVNVEEARRIRVMFNTRTTSRVWVDGNYAFGRTGGLMSPSFHRVPQGQSADMEMAAGEHEIIAAIVRPKDRTAEWVVGAASADTMQWIPEAL